MNTLVPHPRDAALLRAPARTCVGCRKQGAQAQLWRAVTDSAGRVRIGAVGHKREPGRGAYVHPEEKCLLAAVVRGGFERSFRRKLHLPQIATLLPLLPGAAPLGQAGCGAASHKDQE